LPFFHHENGVAIHSGPVLTGHGADIQPLADPVSKAIVGILEIVVGLALTARQESAYTPCAAANDAPAQVAERQTR
jgi:hypothetical protein